MGLSGRVASVVAFLRVGYPRGMPAIGYVPLLGLLPRRASDDEIAMIAGKFGTVGRRQLDNVDIGVELTRVMDEMPSAEDIERVRRWLAAAGGADGRHG